MNKKWFRALFRRRVFIALLLVIQVLFFIYILNSRTKTSTVLSGCLTAVSFVVCLTIISKKDKGAYKLIWVFQILLFPLFGGLFYLLVNFQSSTTKFRKRVSGTEEKAKALLALPGTGEDQAAEVIGQYLPQIQYLQDFAGFPIYTQSSTRYLSPGEKKLFCMLEELEKAEHYIFLEYFIVQEGIMWDSILEILKRKAAQGVLVRVMYDDLGCFFMLPKDYPAQLKQFGIECEIFNHFKPLLTAIQNNRDHRKITVIDGKVAFTGGINLADEYINACEKYGHWKDAAIMVEGKAAWSFTLMFLQMWELCTDTDEDYSVYYPWKDSACPVRADGFVQPYADSPMDKENVGEHVYLQIINNAKKYVYINTPYLIVDDSMVSALSLAAKSGVDVRIVTPHIWDKRLVHMTTRSYYRELIGAGVKIYEYTTGFIHSKTFVSDDRIGTVGTTNLDFRSLYLHFECGVWMADSTAVMEVKQDFLNTLEICQRITLEDCKCGIVARMGQDILRVFAPLM
ncbi:MAG: cardiolipin synthase [Lachnospiraceae bacterium]|nr:cardiolipin synthase [Lachnospiraceae bacterium]